MSERYPDVPNYNDIKVLLNSSHNPYWRDIAKALYYTGARAGELIKIRKRDVWNSPDSPDFVKVTIHTEKNQRQKKRTVPISFSLEPEGAILFTEASKMSTGNEEIEKNNYCFLPPTFGWTEATFLRRMRQAINEEYDGVAPHFFRHCRLTHMVTRFGYDSPELRKYAGWSDDRPASVYTHLKVEDLERKMK